MGYRELPLPKPRPTIVLSGESYDVDYFGMDDGAGTQPDAALRLVFQLGSGLMIYLYVIQAGATKDLGRFAHTLWLEDCAVAEVDTKDYGPPSSVTSSPIALPRIYDGVVLSDRMGIAERAYDLDAPVFVAGASSGQPDLEMSFPLRAGSAPAGRLRWSRRDGWSIERPGSPPHTLGAQDRLRFISRTRG